MGKRILVAGGAGFIGSHLCEALLKAGDEVICLDNLYSGSAENVKLLEQYDHFKFVYHDIVDFYDCHVDQIYNLACPASPVYYQKDRVKTIKTNVLGSINCLELARKYGARILLASTSEIYGDPEVHPQTEDYRGNVNPIGPRACYDEGKRVAETLFTDYCYQYQVDVRIVRIFNTYGPRMLENDGRVVSNFINQALRGENITIYGDGTQTRSFCYVSDLVSGLIALMNREESFCQPVNLGNPDERTISDIAELILKMTKSSSEIVYHPLPVDDPVKRKPSIELAKTVLNWEPTVTLEEGLQKTIAYFQSRI